MRLIFAGRLLFKTTENLQREDLSAIESIQAVVEIVDAELIEDKEYISMGKNPADWVKTLLGKLKSVRRSIEWGYNVSEELRHTSHKRPPDKSFALPPVCA